MPQEILALFANLDRDGSGYLEFQEILTALRLAGMSSTKEGVAEMLKKIREEQQKRMQTQREEAEKRKQRRRRRRRVKPLHAATTTPKRGQIEVVPSDRGPQNLSQRSLGLVPTRTQRHE